MGVFGRHDVWLGAVSHVTVGHHLALPGRLQPRAHFALFLPLLLRLLPPLRRSICASIIIGFAPGGGAPPPGGGVPPPWSMSGVIAYAYLRGEPNLDGPLRCSGRGSFAFLSVGPGRICTKLGAASGGVVT